MHILLLHQYHHSPDCPASCRHYDFVEEWSHRHDVTIITTDAWVEKKITNEYDWHPGKAQVVSMPIRYDNKMGRMARGRAFAAFAHRAASRALPVQKPDVVVGTSTPLSVGWAAARVAANHDVPFVFEVRDLWPDFPIEVGAVPRIFQRTLRNKERALYHRADHIVSLSEDITSHIISKGIDPARLTTLPHGTDLALADKARIGAGALRESLDLGEKRVVLYAGAFGRANDIPTVLKAAELLADDPRVVFVFVGRGYHEDDIRHAAEVLSNVRMIPPVPRHRIFDWFTLAYVSLVTFVDSPAAGSGSPSKFFDALGTACPVIVNSSGWTRRFVYEHDCGWFVPPHDETALAARISRLLDMPYHVARAGEQGRLAIDTFDRPTLARQFEDVLHAVTGQANTRVAANTTIAA